MNHHSIALKDYNPWKVEQEWRTVFSLLQNDPEERKARVQHWSDGRPFVDVPVLTVDPDERRMPIVAVTAGSATDKASVEELLRRYGYDHVEVRVSAVATEELPLWFPK